MDELVADLLGVVVDGREPDVALVVHPDNQGVEVSNQHPLPDVELPLQDHQWVLDVLLGDPQRLLASHVILDLDEVVVAGYPTASRQTCWLQDPNVVVLGQVILVWESFLVLLKDLLYFLKELVRLLLFWLVLDYLVFRLVPRGLFLLLFLLFFLGFFGDSNRPEFAVDRFQPFFMFLLG